MTISDVLIDRVAKLPSSQIMLVTEFLDTLPNESADTGKRIGVAKDITFPANFDEIDYGTEELFGIDT